jgi:hypothetical protein
MKYILLILILANSHLNFSQTVVQKGYVREQNSGKKPIPKVQIIISRAIDASDDSGSFRLTFINKKAGDIVRLDSIYKAGYELVNESDLRQFILTNFGRLPTDIILAKVGTIDKAKKEYYAISDKSLKEEYEKQKKSLETEQSNAKISNEKYLERIKNLEKQYINQQKIILELSEQFATVNFDDVSEVYKEALQLFKKGKIEKAISVLEGANLTEQTQKIIQERIVSRKCPSKTKRNHPFISADVCFKI